MSAMTYKKVTDEDREATKENCIMGGCARFLGLEECRKCGHWLTEMERRMGLRLVPGPNGLKRLVIRRDGHGG